MFQTYRRILLLAVLVAFGAAAGLAQETAQETMVPHATNIIGLEGVANNATGTVTVENGVMWFHSKKAKVQIPAAVVVDVFTGEDSQRAIGGFAGTISSFGPYGSGRFLSLFRKSVDTLTIEYRDAESGLHGVVLMMDKGGAAVVKKELVDAGAHASIPVEEEMKAMKEKKEKKK